MVGPGPATSAAAEERQRKLQEYLAAKGKLKSQNTKPYLKTKNNCPNLPPSKSTIRPQKNITNHVILPVKDKSSTSIKLQPRPANITGCQKPKLEPPKLPGKRLISTYVSTNPNCKPSSKSGQQHKARSSTVGELSKKPTGSLNIQDLKTTKKQVIDQRTAKCTDCVDNIHVENESLSGFLKDTNKENLPQILSKPGKKPDPGLGTRNKPKTNSYNLTKNSLASKQVLGKSSVNNAILKDRMNKQSVGETRIRTLTLKSQQPSRGRDLARPGENPPRIAPSQLSQTLSKTQSSKKPVVKEIKVNRSKYERPNETKLRLYPVTEQKVKPTKPRTDSRLLPGGNNSRYSNIKQNQKSTQTCFKPQPSCVLQKSKATSQKHNSTVGHFNSVISSTPTIRANGTNGNKCGNSFQQKAQTLDSKLKKSLPQSHFLNKTAPKTQAGFTNRNGQKDPNGTQANTNIKKKATVEDRRKQLEEWQKSKGKTYKRPPMEFKTKRKVIEEMNISFWKSIEKEEEERKAQLELSSKINNTLTECLKLIEGGEFSNEIHTILSSIPEAEKFAKFWICKAKLLASKGTFDIIGLYEEAIKNRATPIQELRDFVVNILQDPNRTTEAAETNITSVEELTKKSESIKSCLSPKEKEQVAATPQITKAEQDNHLGIKLQIASIPRINGMPEVQDMKLITPVRRSARIERAVSRYPEMLQEHDLVVASLDELLEVEETECFIFRRNEALPVTLGFQVLES
ncbi:cytoskeleton-associated protein 2-like [Otolemur garnettii]|uniref:cytoskeleton-associated protein 2-like n=1 Tax=Otolemur garnettii TaxID=30611 RepID=UPI000C7EFCE4|nr:cytoskeleton-associated protein 2-like [Otolemur garnettii]